MEERSFSLQVATLGPTGLSPFAPGTVATAVVGIPAACLLSLFPDPYATLFLALCFFLACYVSEVAEKELQKTDPGEVVIDELVGFLITMFGLPLTVPSLIAGFFAFRLFDIWKPWPVDALQDNLKGGLGVVMDDVAAGVYAHAVVWVILRAWQ